MRLPCEPVQTAGRSPRGVQFWHRQGEIPPHQRRRPRTDVLGNPRHGRDPAAPFHLQSPHRHGGILRKPRPERDSRPAEKEARHTPRGRNKPPRQAQGDGRVRRLRRAIPVAMMTYHRTRWPMGQVEMTAKTLVGPGRSGRGQGPDRDGGQGHRDFAESSQGDRRSWDALHDARVQNRPGDDE